MSDISEIAELELHAFIDGELDAEQCRAFEAKMKVYPALAERMAAFRADKDMLKRVYAPAADSPIPTEWIALALGSVAPSRNPISWPISWRLVGSIAAVVALSVIGAVSYWERQPSGASDVVQAALDARTNAAHAQETIPIPAGAEIGKYSAVLSSTVALKVRAPDLRRMGYRLTGILLYPHSPAAAELLYRDGKNRSFTLYLRRSDGKPRFDQFERDGLRVCVWQDEVLSTVMAGDVSTAAMQRLASLAYTGLTL
jgi:anti-sigma factor RsiW